MMDSWRNAQPRSATSRKLPVELPSKQLANRWTEDHWKRIKLEKKQTPPRLNSPAERRVAAPLLIYGLFVLNVSIVHKTQGRTAL